MHRNSYTDGLFKGVSSSRFGVEVGGAQEALRGRERRFCVEARELAPSHSDGADWQLNGTTTDGSINDGLASMKSAVFGPNITLCVIKSDGDIGYRRYYEIKKTQSIFDQFTKKLKTGDIWEKMEVCSKSQCREVCSIQKTDKTIFDAECKKAIAIADAEVGRPPNDISLSVMVIVRELVDARDARIARDASDARDARDAAEWRIARDARYIETCADKQRADEELEKKRRAYHRRL
jgi:hypothetical protein